MAQDVRSTLDVITTHTALCGLVLLLSAPAVEVPLVQIAYLALSVLVVASLLTTAALRQRVGA